MAKLTEAQYKEKYEKEKNDLKLLSEKRISQTKKGIQRELFTK